MRWSHIHTQNKINQPLKKVPEDNFQGLEPQLHAIVLVELRVLRYHQQRTYCNNLQQLGELSNSPSL